MNYKYVSTYLCTCLYNNVTIFSSCHGFDDIQLQSMPGSNMLCPVGDKKMNKAICNAKEEIQIIS